MRLDLNRARILLQAELPQNAGAEGRPVELRIGGHVGVVVARRAVHLGQRHDCGDRGVRVAQARCNVGELLAQGRGGCRLAMRARQHGLRRLLVGNARDHIDQPLQLRQQDLIAGPAEHQGVGGIVDVFRRTRKMDEFRRAGKLRVTGDLVLEPVLDRLDVVIGLALDLLDALGVRFRKIINDGTQHLARTGRKRRQFGQARIREAGEPGNLDLDPVGHEASLGQQRPQSVAAGCVTPVERRHRIEHAE